VQAIRSCRRWRAPARRTEEAPGQAPVSRARSERSARDRG
jgi:hypothetical protein